MGMDGKWETVASGRGIEMGGNMVVVESGKASGGREGGHAWEGLCKK